MSVTRNTLLKMKENNEKIVVLTAYDYYSAKLADEGGVHMILVGDSLGMVIQGESSTLPVTMDEMLYHTKIVSKTAKNAMIIGDMPFMSYQADINDAIMNAGRFLKEAGAHAVKLEGGVTVKNVIREISNAGIPVQGHIGLTPQSVHNMGGFKVQRDEERLINDAVEVEQAGAFSVVLEGIPADIAEKISQKISIPTIGIGAGASCDGQVLVFHDALGLNSGHIPKFVKKFANLHEEATKGISKFIEEVQSGEFPGKDHCY
ncbi:MAG: 3-methyl-2-oxobutanoate hydroxymethyltransferase [Desulfobacterales bacterium]|nr:3-methyl-2-oxobutanoate hydroxymethyltransferase [Desulfobacterales bacterium]MCP4159570.1 3-methyl-2-oxobutanoate hydroxymethyltransferase [Deltaproteobacteria bacterium]